MKKLTQYLKTQIQISNYSLFIYGSAAHSLSTSRDIDAIVISSEIDTPSLISLPYSIKQNRKPCNLYFVPEEVLLNDLKFLFYGGFYIHKFALSFKPILSEGEVINAPLLFWKNHLIYFESLFGREIIIDELMKLVHFIILYYRPTFARSLVKFISQPSRIKELRLYISKHIYNSPNNNFQEKNILMLRENLEKSFYNYWIEYKKHKDKSAKWGRKTFNKISYSSSNINISKISNYFESIRSMQLEIEKK